MILAIVGPTASGKTELGLRMAKEQNGEIISVDSRQVYRHLAVGTAKPKGTWTQDSSMYLVQNIPYHLVDFLDPSVRFSVADFVTLAHEKIVQIQTRGKVPILVGGTGLYFKGLVEGMAPLPSADPGIRNRLKKEAEDLGRAALHARLETLDPEAAQKIPANNIQRLVRALEVYELTGKPISQWHKEHQTQETAGNKSGSYALKFIGIDLPREELHRHIEERAHGMMEQGMVEETRALLKQGTLETAPALTGLGYPRVVAYLKGKLSKEECLRLLTQDTRQYAKRQMTYFRHQLPVLWNAL